MKISLRTYLVESGWLARLTGDSRSFPMEHRIFNGICILSILIIGYNIPYNLFAGLEVSALIFSGLLILFCEIYYLSRCKRKLQISINIASSVVLVMMGLNYFFSSGVQGATLLSFAIAFFLVMIVSPRKQSTLWAILYFVAGVILLVAEYWRPDLIQFSYPNRVTMIVDLGCTYVIAIFMIFLGLYYLKSVYIAEKDAVQEKKLALQKMNTEKTKLFSAISHDLHAPLATIQSYMAFLRDGGVSEEEKKVAERELAKTVSATQELLYNLLSWSRSQLSNSELNLQAVHLPDTVEKALHSLVLPARQKKIRIIDETRITPAPLADVNLLLFIIRNIVGNAVKFTPEQGTVTIGSGLKNGKCLIFISDTGNGIPSEQMKEIFSLNVRSTFGTQNEKGLGLGLFLCKEYVEAQNGNIYFESAPGKGTCFYITLPLAESVPVQSPELLHVKAS